MIFPTIYLLGHSCSEFWSVLHSDNAQMWFKETRKPGKNCGWDGWDDGLFNHLELSGPLSQKASPEHQPLQCIGTVLRIHCATIEPVRACTPKAAGTC